MPETPLQEQFGQIDIYLFDQLLKGRILPGMRVLARRLAPALPESNFSVQAVEHMAFGNAWADVVI